MLRTCFASLRPVTARFERFRISSRPTLAAFALGSVIAALGLSALAAPAARAEGCGPGVLGRATAWKDRNAIYDFAAACDWHDRCYGARGYGWDPVRSPGRASVPYPRDWCDSGFHLWMRRSCDSRPAGPAVGVACHAVADAFHWLVRAFGPPWYRRADGHRRLAVLTFP